MRRLSLLLTALVIVTAACGDDAASPTEGSTTMPAADSPAATEPTTEITTLTTADGLSLEATLWRGGATWVVLAHMRPADRSSWEGFGPLLQAAGYTALSYDNRGYGGSAGAKEPFELIQDAQAALDAARRGGATRIVFVGASMNGAAAITLAAEEEFAALVGLSAVPSFPSAPDAGTLAGAIDEPALFVAAEDDGSAADSARSFAAQAADPTLDILPTGGHGTAMLGADPGLAGRILAWLTARVPA